MFDEKGVQTWGAELDIFGAVKNLQGDRSDCPFRYPGQYEDGEIGLYYNRFRYYDADGGEYVSQDPIGLLGGNPNIYAYISDPIIETDSLGLAGCYSGSLNKKASSMDVLVPGTKAWNDAVKDAKSALAKGNKFQARVPSSTDAKKFLKEVHGKMDRRKANVQSKRPDGVPKYPKGYEQHQSPEGGLGDLQHIKWYNNGTDGHIFYSTPN
jgi:RHS repeat-associated protein